MVNASSSLESFFQCDADDTKEISSGPDGGSSFAVNVPSEVLSEAAKAEMRQAFGSVLFTTAVWCTSEPASELLMLSAMNCSSECAAPL